MDDHDRAIFISAPLDPVCSPDLDDNSGFAAAPSVGFSHEKDKIGGGRGGA